MQVSSHRRQTSHIAGGAADRWELKIILVRAVINSLKKWLNEKHISSDMVPKYGGKMSDVAQKAISNDSWPVPRLFSENLQVDTPDIPCSLLPDWLGDYCETVTETLQTPPGLAVMLGLSAVAACVQRKFEVCINDSYSEPLNLWTITALEPGSRKTAALTKLTKPLRDWEQAELAVIEPLLKKIRCQNKVKDKLCSNIIAKAAKPDITDEEKEYWISQLQDHGGMLHDSIPSPKLLADDVTPAKLQEQLANNGERLAVLSDEGGIFETLTGPACRNINVFLQAHAGGAVSVGRQAREVNLQKPAVTFGLAVQPDVIAGLGRGRKTRWQGNGFLDRFLYCIPNNTVGFRDTNMRACDASREGCYHLAMSALLQIKPACGNGGGHSHALKLESEAFSHWQAFSQGIEARLADGHDLESIRGWGSKLSGAALRFAGILHLVENTESYAYSPCPNASIRASTMVKATELCLLLISHAKAAFDIVDGGRDLIDAKHIFKWLQERQLPSFIQSDIYRDLRRFKDSSRVSAALKVLTARNIISTPVKVRTTGRPTILHDVNPQIFDE